MIGRIGRWRVANLSAGERITEVRIAQGMTGKEVAEALGISCP